MSRPYYNINAAVSNEIIREVGEEKNDWICIKWTAILQEGIYAEPVSLPTPTTFFASSFTSP